MASQIEGGLLLVPDLQEQEVYCGSARIEVVGVQYYNGIIGNKEAVCFRREPGNQYDANAIGVHAAFYPDLNKLGHIAKVNAALMSPLMDYQGLRCEGVVPYGAANTYSIPLDAHFFAPRASMANVQKAIRMLPKATVRHINYDPTETQPVDLTYIQKYGSNPPPAAGSGASSSSSRGAYYGTSGSVAGLSEEALVGKHLDSLFMEPIPYDQQPEAPQPASVLTPLYPHQRKALAWMMERERPLNVAQALEIQRAQAAAAAAAAARNGAGASSSAAAAFFALRAAPTDAAGAALSGIVSRAQATASQRAFMWEARLDTAGRVCYLNVATNSTVRAPPQLPRGGIIADEMGLGKTLQAVALIAVAKERALALQAGSSSGAGALHVATGPTLIVAPVSVLGVWREQLASHVAPGLLNVYLHYRQERSNNPAVLAAADVVLTSYSTLASETALQMLEGAAPSNAVGGPGRASAQQSPLQRVQWGRVILDEAHSIRNKSTKQARAAYALLADARWCLSGTPITNTLSDVQSLLRFLRVEPFNDSAWFNRLVTRLIKNGDPLGFERLAGLMAACCLRRTKTQRVGPDNEPLLSLPPRRVHTVRLQLAPTDRQRYEALAAVTRVEFSRLLAAGSAAAAAGGGSEGALLSSSASVLEVLLRMRQLACHPALVPDAVLARAEGLARGLNAAVASSSSGAASSSSSGGATGSSALLSASREVIAQLMAAMELVNEEEDCAICLEQLAPDSSRVLTCCRHAYHKDCLVTSITVQKGTQGGSTCPLCRHPLGPADLIAEEDLRARAAQMGIGAVGAAGSGSGGGGGFPGGEAESMAPELAYLSTAKLDALVRGIKTLVGGGSAEQAREAMETGVMPRLAAAAAAPPAAAVAAAGKAQPSVPYGSQDLNVSAATLPLASESAAPVQDTSAVEGEEEAPAPVAKGKRGRPKKAAAPAPAPAAETSRSSRGRAVKKNSKYASAGSDDEQQEPDEEEDDNYRDGDDDDDDEAYGRGGRGGKRAKTAGGRGGRGGAKGRKSAAPPAAAAPAASSSSSSAYYAAPAASSSSVPAGAAQLYAPIRSRVLSGLRSKSVVFSQWTSLLDVVGFRLAAEGVTCVRIDGSTSATNRELAVSLFQKDPAVHVILISIKAGGTGLTLTAAANCFVLDPTWSPAVEDQACDRIHRLGQVSGVDIFRLIATGTIEENVLKLQERKRQLEAGAFGAVRTRDDIRRMRLDDLRLLMDVGDLQ